MIVVRQQNYLHIRIRSNRSIYYARHIRVTYGSISLKRGTIEESFHYTQGFQRILYRLYSIRGFSEQIAVDVFFQDGGKRRQAELQSGYP